MASLPFSTSAPASSGNLGPGFDVFALALDLRNRVQVRRGSGRVEVRGRGAAGDEHDAAGVVLPTDASNLVAVAFERAAGTSIADAGVDLRCDNRIPPARGLGSSTAAAACGLVAGWHVADVDWDVDRLCDELAELDGHADNAAACAHGGAVLCHDRPALDGEPARMDVVALGPVDWLVPVVVVPARALATSEARGVLPDSYSRTDVVRALGAGSLLAAGLVGGHLDLLEDALHADVLHEPQRAALVPELAEVRESLHATRALGATLSGAGPAVLVWCAPDATEQAAGSLAIDFPEHDVMPLRIAADGARVDD